jgi:hypothetical protein
MSIPNEFICPISMDIMKDPVICEDGYSYEKNNIINWLKRSGTSPMTREKMSLERILPNDSVKSAIDKWNKERNKKRPKNNSNIKPVPSNPSSDVPVLIPILDYSNTHHIIVMPSQQYQPLPQNPQSNQQNGNNSNIINNRPSKFKIFIILSALFVFLIILFKFILS